MGRYIGFKYNFYFGIYTAHLHDLPVPPPPLIGYYRRYDTAPNEGYYRRYIGEGYYRIE